MLDARLIRENTEQVKLNTQQRNMDASLVDDWLKVDIDRKKLVSQIEEIRQKKNSGRKDMDIEDQKNIAKLKTKLQELEKQLIIIDETWTALISQIPNMHSADVPIGKTEDENVTVHTYKEPATFDFPVKNHVELTVDR